MIRTREFQKVAGMAMIFFMLAGLALVLAFKADGPRPEKKVLEPIRLASTKPEQALAVHQQEEDEWADIDYANDPRTLKQGNLGPPLLGTPEQEKQEIWDRAHHNGASAASVLRINNEITQEEFEEWSVRLSDKNFRQIVIPAQEKKFSRLVVNDIVIVGSYTTTMAAAGRALYTNSSTDGTDGLQWRDPEDRKYSFLTKDDCGGQEVILVEGSICDPGTFHANKFSIPVGDNRIDTTEEESRAEEQAQTEQGKNFIDPTKPSGTTNAPHGDPVGSPPRPAQPSAPVFQLPIILDPVVEGKTVEPGT